MGHGLVNGAGEVIEPAIVGELADGLAGRLLFPGDDGFDDSRALWNAAFHRRPAVIARCQGAPDVTDCVRFAVEHRMPLSVRGGGHNVAGTGVAEGGFAIDLSGMQAVQVDLDARRVRVEGGCTWGELDRVTQAHGMAVPGAVVSSSGVAGVTLGGGVGWTLRRRGLTCDRLLALELVTATGERIRADGSEHPELFWACRGGGGNFGVATALEFELHEQGPVLGGRLVYPRARAGDLLAWHREFMTDAPWELTAHIGLSTTPTGEPVAAVLLCYTGDLDEGRRVLEPIRALGTPMDDGVAVRPYNEMQRLLDPLFPPGRCHDWKSRFFAGVPGDEAYATLLEHAARATSPLTSIGVESFSGRASVPETDATAFPHRDKRFNLIVRTQWEDPSESDRHRSWAKELAGAMRRFTDGAYYNYLNDEGAAGVRAALGANLERLREIKRRWDPENAFRSNHNIEP